MPAQPRRRRRRTGAAALAAALAAGGCGSAGPAPAPGGDTTGGTGSGRPPAPAAAPLAWSGCGDGLECASLPVPVDHTHPDGATIDLAVARRRAGDRAGRLGALVINPGGPGASGIDMLRAGVPAADRLGRFDLVSWDPRGVGASEPLACDDTLPAYRSLDWTPDDPTETAAVDEQAERIARNCRRDAGELADHLTTTDTARDLDALRAALARSPAAGSGFSGEEGDGRLDYLGFSYGTAIGLRYAALYPGRVRAMVLDGVADPRDDLATSLGGQARALDGQLGAVLGPGLATFDRVLAAAEAGRSALGPTTVAYAAIAASYAPGGGTALAAALDAAEVGRDGPLRTLAATYWSGARYGPYLAVVCSDQGHPLGARGYDALVTRLTEESPRFGGFVANELRPCAWWPATTPTTGVATPGAPPILVLGNTGDAATPYASAVRVAADLAAGVLITYDGEGHTSLGQSACVDDLVRRYLEALATPPPGTRCS